MAQLTIRGIFTPPVNIPFPIGGFASVTLYGGGQSLVVQLTAESAGLATPAPPAIPFTAVVPSPANWVVPTTFDNQVVTYILEPSVTSAGQRLNITSPANASSAQSTSQTATVTLSSTTQTATATISSTTQSAETRASSSLPTTGSPIDATDSPGSSCTIDPQKDDHSTGELAGVAVGCAIGGALIAGLLVFLFFHRRSHRASRNSALSEKGLSPLRGQGEALFVGTGAMKAWERDLPQSEADSTLRSIASCTLDQIEMHVENFYTNVNGRSLDVETQSELEGLESSHVSGSISSLLSQSTKSTTLIKHYIANLIVARITLDVSTGASFLPQDYTALQPSPSVVSKPSFYQALSQWRVVTSYLRVEPEHDPQYQAERDQTITAAAQQVCRAFEPWARGDNNGRLRSMINIMKRASDMAITLFAQPASFEWTWVEAATKNGSTSHTREGDRIVMLPGLYKTTDQDARPLAAPLHLVEPRIGSISRS